MARSCTLSFWSRRSAYWTCTERCRVEIRKQERTDGAKSSDGVFLNCERGRHPANCAAVLLNTGGSSAYLELMRKRVSLKSVRPEKPGKSSAGISAGEIRGTGRSTAMTPLQHALPASYKMKKATHHKNALVTGSIVYIRPPQTYDCDEFIRLNRTSLRFYRGLVSPITTREQFADYVKRCAQSDFEGLLVCRKEDDAIVGSINLSQIFRGGFKSAYLDYRAGAAFAGRGYMTDAIELILGYTFNQMKLHRLEANIQPDNRASIALVKRVGFTKEGYSRRYLKIGGRWRDHERWAILAEDWQTKRRSK